MSVSKVNPQEISNQILEIFRKNSNTRSGRMDTLGQISELAKGIINNLNNIDDSVYEITDELEDFNEEYELLMNEIESTNFEIEKNSKSSTALDSEILDLEQKEKEGTITEVEAERLNYLRAELQSVVEKSSSLSGNLDKLTSSSSSIASKMSNYSEKLEDITSSMADYKEAGTEIKESANKYGKKNMNVEKAMERNESSWWGNAAKYGGIAAIGGAGLATGGYFIAAPVASTIAIPGAVVGLGTGIGLGTLFGQGKQMQKYLDKAGYTEVGDNSQVFYDAVNHDYIAEYDVLEQKGGNQIGGKMRKATAKTFSYGKTIEVASLDIEQKAEQAKSKIKNENTDA